MGLILSLKNGLDKSLKLLNGVGTTDLTVYATPWVEDTELDGLITLKEWKISL